MYTLPPLPYAYNALEPAIDEQTMIIHHDKHHGTYVDKLNKAIGGIAIAMEHGVNGVDQSMKWALADDAENLLRNLNSLPESIRADVRNNGGGHVNHSLFWSVMAPPKQGGGGEPTGAILDVITASFGSFLQFQEKFTAAGLGRFGSGWVWLIKDGTSVKIIDSPNQDSPLLDGKIPVLGLDVWEHAYYLRYQNVRADYIRAWWSVVNWTAVNTRFLAST